MWRAREEPSAVIQPAPLCARVMSGSQSGSYGMLDADTGDVLATVAPNGGNAALDHGNLYYIRASDAR